MMSSNIPSSPPNPPHTEVNPYSASSSAVSPVLDVSDELAAMDFKSLKKLYLRSHNVSTITGLLVIGILVLSWVVFYLEPKENGGGIDYFGYFAIAIYLYIFAAIGMVMRSSWGRMAGIIVSALSLLSFPIGTIFGVAGLFAFIGAPRLFGAGRVTHGQLKKVYKASERQHKEEEKAVKLAAKEARRASKTS